jgi:hypothetical protein
MDGIINNEMLGICSFVDYRNLSIYCSCCNELHSLYSCFKCNRQICISCEDDIGIIFICLICRKDVSECRHVGNYDFMCTECFKKE